MVINQDLLAVAKEYKEINYENFWDWLIQVDPISHHWKYEPTYVLSQCSYLLGGFLTLWHALARGGRLPYLWLGVALHGFLVEFICYISPDIDNFWHSQTPLMFLGRRLPIHIILLYPCFIYNASVAVAKAQLPRWAEPFAVGLSVVAIDIPYDIVSVNFLHWTWHDTDPNIGDRHYWVPWNSYYFHSCFAAGFTFWFHFTRKCFCKTDKWEADSTLKELICTIIAGFLGAPTGVIMFVLVYHPLHDIYKVHSEVTFFIIFTFFLLIIWSGDRVSHASKLKFKIHWTTWLLVFHLLVHYTVFLVMVAFFKPENEIAIGLKEPIGPCNKYVPVQNIFGLELKKRKYLCVTDYDEKYFDFNCLKKPPSDGAIWYTACGVPLPNKVEYVAIIATIWIMGAVIFGNLHFRSGGDNVFKITGKSSKHKTN